MACRVWAVSRVHVQIVQALTVAACQPLSPTSLACFSPTPLATALSPWRRTRALRGIISPGLHLAPLYPIDV